MPSRVSSPGRRGAAVAVAAAVALPVLASAGNRPEARETRGAADVKQTVTVAKGATVEVITFLSSPSQTFSPAVDCTLR
jgi:hypothetical protein